MLPPGRTVCDPCEVSVLRHEGGCPRCADLLSEDTCERCADAPPPFERVDVGLVYGGTVREAVRRLKFDDAPWVAEPLSELAFPTIPSSWAELDVFIPVPLHISRHRERGYNQARLVGAALAQRAGKPLEERLHRVRATAAVAELAPNERAVAVRDAFKADDLRGRAVALVDDVVTTSATSREAAAALRAAGASRVIIVAMARGGRGAESG